MTDGQASMKNLPNDFYIVSVVKKQIPRIRKSLA